MKDYIPHPYPIECKLCGRYPEDTQLECLDSIKEWWECKDGYGCKKLLEERLDE